MNAQNLPEIECLQLETPIGAMVNEERLLERLRWVRLGPVHLATRDSSDMDGTSAYQETFVTCMWTATHLHVWFHCDDTDIWGTHTERDGPLYEEEVVEVFLCSTGDVRHYFEFEVSPRNVVFDAWIHSPDIDRRTMKVDSAWDCADLLTSVACPSTVHTTSSERRTPRHQRNYSDWWQPEINIPFKGLGVDAPGPGDVWRANFFRIDRPAAPAPAEFSAWSPTGETPANFHVPSRFGRLVFGD